MPAEVLDKRKDIVASDVGGGDSKIEPETLTYGRDGDRTGHGEAIMPVPTRMHGRLAARGPGPADRGLQPAATLIDQDQGTALTPGFF
jgi:hypothetical protein